MNFEPFEQMLDKKPSPQEYITELFERTEDGVLYIPASCTYTGVFEPYPDYDYRCKIDWNFKKYESVLEKFTHIFESFKKIGPFENELRYHPEKAKELLKDAGLYQIWHKYVRPFDTPQFDSEKIRDIDERFETIALAQDCAMNYAKGKKLNDYEKEILEENLNLEVSEEEKNYYYAFHNSREEQAVERVGESMYAYDVILFAQRFCRLIYLGAPEVIVNNESINFAEKFVLHECRASVKTASSTFREQREQIEQMSDDELDEYDQNRVKSNSAKSLMPLFVHQILQKHSSVSKPLRQQDILDFLKIKPYEINVERKALSRTLHALENMFVFKVYHNKNGWWKE